MSDLARKPTTADITLARSMHADGWLITEITAYLNRQGLRVSRHAVGYWVAPERAERRREQHAARARELSRRQRREARMAALVAAGLSAPAIAKVMTLDFPEHPMTVWQVRYALQAMAVAA